jgi:hypothetical protein
MIVDASSTSYYDEVREVLPKVAQRAVLATLGEKNILQKTVKGCLRNHEES